MRKLIMLGLIIAISLSTSAQCPIEGKRNNGNPGVCEARLQLLFTTMPTSTTIDSIVINGVKQTWVATFIETTTPGGLFQLNYCIPVGNFPPIGAWTIYFASNNGLPCVVCVDCGGPLAISFTDFKAQRINSKQVKVTFSADDNKDVRVYKILLSRDGRVWQEKRLIVPASTYSATYSTILNL